MENFDLIPLLPELFLALTAMGLLIVGVDRGNEGAHIICWASAFSYVIAFILLDVQ